MLSKVLSSAVHGIDAYVVEVETHMESSIPSITIVGLPDSAIKESRERVVAAIKNSGFRFLYNRRITINLAPADIKKEGSAFDLPIALGILAAQGEISEEKLDDLIIMGELALDGSLRPIHGALPIAVEVSKGAKRGMLVPEANAKEAAMAGEGIQVYPVSNLIDAVKFLNNGLDLKPLKVSLETIFDQEHNYAVDFQDVRGQEHVKSRGAEGHGERRGPP